MEYEIFRKSFCGRVSKSYRQRKRASRHDFQRVVLFKNKRKNMEQEIIEKADWQTKFRDMLRNVERPKLDVYNLYLNRNEFVPNFLDITNANVESIHEHFIKKYELSIGGSHSFLELDFSKDNLRNEQFFYYLKNVLIHFNFSENAIFIIYGNGEKDFVLKLVEDWKR